MMQDCEQRASQVISQALSRALRPAVMCSFGKDSIALVHLVHRVNPHVPIIWHRELAKHTVKYDFARIVIDLWKLEVHDFPPARSGIYVQGDQVDIGNYYLYGAGDKYLYLPTRLQPINSEDQKEFVCALADVYCRPHGRLEPFPWDVIFIGHKASDVDAVFGPVPIERDLVLQKDVPAFAFPLRLWTDKDVWDYIELYKLPVHIGRYCKVDGVWKEREDKSCNPDAIAACYACMVTDQSVYCPLLRQQVGSVQADLLVVKDPLPNYVKKEQLCQAG